MPSLAREERTILNAWAPPHTLIRYVLGVATFACVAASSFACDRAPTSPSALTPNGTGTANYEDYGDTACPPDVPDSECVPVTAEERERIRSDIMDYVRWEVPECRNMGLAILDFAENGDLRKFPEYSTFWGWWQHANYAYPGQPEQISFERSTVTQGWSSQRIMTAIHEGTHRYYQAGPEVEDVALFYQDHCINW